MFEVVPEDQEQEVVEAVHRYRAKSGEVREERLVARKVAVSASELLLGDADLPPYSVVIPMYGEHALTADCIHSVLKHGKPAEIIVVDDGSEPGYVAAPSLPMVKVVRLEKNSGFPAAMNAGVGAASSAFVVGLNNDVEVGAGLFSCLLSPLRDPSVGVVGPEGKSLPADSRPAGRNSDLPDYIEMSVFGVRRSVWMKLGGLDAATFGRGYFEDVDFSRRVEEAGYSLKALKGQPFKHQGGGTFGRSPQVIELVRKNHRKYRAKHFRGRALLVLAALGCNGGGKVSKRIIEALRSDGWDVSVCSFMPWGTSAMDFGDVGKLTPKTTQGEWDLVVSTFHTTMPFAAQIPCPNRFALIQSDEPQWGPDAHARKNFETSGFRHIIIADHMRCFDKKYGMNIVGQIDNGVDSKTFYPTWLFTREWPHRIMVIRKGVPVWFAGQEYAEEAVLKLAERYPDLGVVVLGGGKPDWPCKVEHVKTYNEAEINGLYNSVSAVVIPSLIEGRSLVPLEAMAAGCPVVSTRVGMCYARDGEDALLVPYKDSDAIVEAVVKVFTQPALRERLAKNGLALAQKYTWEREQQQFLDIINRELVAT